MEGDGDVGRVMGVFSCWKMEWERLGKVAVPRLPPGGSVC